MAYSRSRRGRGAMRRRGPKGSRRSSRKGRGRRRSRRLSSYTVSRGGIRL